MELKLFCLVFVMFDVILASTREDSLCDFEKHSKDPSEDAMKKLKLLEGKRFPVSDPLDGGFSYDVGICTTGVPKESLPAGDEKDWTNVAVIQKEKKAGDGGTRKTHSLGDFTKTEVMSGTNWLYLEYEGGDTYGSHCSQEARRTIILMVCDPEDSQGSLRIVEEQTDKTTDCYYLFELSHQALCDPEADKGLGPGSIIVIVLVSLVGAYLLLGFLYQRIAKGAQGREQIPNYAFWQDVGNLAADGCDFVCRSNTRGEGSRQYRGIGDEQITQQTPEDPPEDTDEHLLPM